MFQKYLTIWINILYSMFKQLPLWVSKEVEMETMPDCFEPHYPDTRVIVDCTELFIQMPSSLRAQLLI